MSWGIRPPTGDTVRLWWGARAIYETRNYGIDLLWDRQAMVNGTIEERKALETWINKTGLPKIRQYAQNARLAGDSNQTLAIIADGYHIEACPRGSCGYLYLGAWKEQT